jgi:hypothetical protein
MANEVYVYQWAAVRKSEPDQILLAGTLGVEHEAEHGVSLQRLGEPAESLGAGAVLAALDSRDHRHGGAHPLGDLLLRQAEFGAPHDHQPGDLLEGGEPVLRLAIAPAPAALALNLGLDRRSDWTLPSGHHNHRSTHTRTSLRQPSGSEARGHRRYLTLTFIADAALDADQQVLVQRTKDSLENRDGRNVVPTLEL